MWLGKAIMVGALLVGSYAGSGAYAVHSLFEALRAKDSDALRDRVDFQSVRASLKEQASAEILKENPVTGAGGLLAAAMAPALINNLIDTMVTPEWLATSFTFAGTNFELDIRKFLSSVSVRGPVE